MAERGRLRWQLADTPDPSGSGPTDVDELTGETHPAPAPSQGQLFDVPVFEREPGRGVFEGIEFLHVRARQIINQVPAASRMPFRYTINAYRGCTHACTYCFARPTHTYLDLDAGRDFERRIVVKVNAVSRLRAELAPRRWAGDAIAMGTNTDPYQRCEGKYRLTRGIVEVLSAARNPFSILTKSTLILRDLDVLAAAAERTDVRVSFSIGTLDEHVWRTTEPGTPHPARRVDAIRRLTEAGLECGVLIAPVLPGLSDRPEQLREVAEACIDAGATSVSSVLLHLRPGVKEVFFEHLSATHPDLVDGYRRRYRGSYAPKAEQQAVTAVVQESVAAARVNVRLRRGRAAPPAGSRGSNRSEAGRRSTASAPASASVAATATAKTATSKGLASKTPNTADTSAVAGDHEAQLSLLGD